MGLFDSLSVTEKVTAGLATVAIGAIGYKIGTYAADTKHSAIQEKVKKFATVKSYLVKSLTAKGFCDDASLAVYLGTTCPTELDLNEKTGEARGVSARLFKDSGQPGSFQKEPFATGEIARQLEAA